jgi:hypothetical protein
MPPLLTHLPSLGKPHRRRQPAPNCEPAARNNARCFPRPALLHKTLQQRTKTRRLRRHSVLGPPMLKLRDQLVREILFFNPRQADRLTADTSNR